MIQSLSIWLHFKLTEEGFILRQEVSPYMGHLIAMDCDQRRVQSCDGDGRWLAPIIEGLATFPPSASVWG